MCSRAPPILINSLLTEAKISRIKHHKFKPEIWEEAKENRANAKLPMAAVRYDRLNFHSAHLPFQCRFACVEWVDCAGHVI